MAERGMEKLKVAVGSEPCGSCGTAEAGTRYTVGGGFTTCARCHHMFGWILVGEGVASL